MVKLTNKIGEMTLKRLTSNAFGRTENENNMNVLDAWHSKLFFLEYIKHARIRRRID
ncbi:hypothetical protein [uncultured Bacteroides sp.]|uniref:hypothetical protein n=1 Tax=uncultured Bacteroides sp. TaxID=162156 RepID=UPI0025E07CEB|nr:hypothetical protein [uncultured Bacteroides sp.]